MDLCLCSQLKSQPFYGLKYIKDFRGDPIKYYDLIKQPSLPSLNP